MLVNETVLCDTAPCYLSPACLHLCQALPRLPISVPFCLDFQMCFSSHSLLRVCLTAASFCTYKGCVFEPGQGRQVAGSSSDKLQTLPVSDSLFEGKGLQAGMCPSLSSWLLVCLEERCAKALPCLRRGAREGLTLATCICSGELLCSGTTAVCPSPPYAFSYN